MKTYVEINLDNLRNNVECIKATYPEYEYYIGVLKADAYGHGFAVAKDLYEAGINYFAVFSLDEALVVRNYCEAPILVFEPISVSDIEEVANNNITVTVNSLDYLNSLAALELKHPLKIHLMLNTGMNAIGINDKVDVEQICSRMRDNSDLILEGIYTHFMTVGVFDNIWDKQIAKFNELTSLIDLDKIPIVHLANSTNILAHPKLPYCNAARMGQLVYGYNVTQIRSDEGLKNKLRNLRTDIKRRIYKISDICYNIKLDLKPVMSFHTSIMQIMKLKKGDKFGYNATFKATREMLIAILPIGYANGIGQTNNNRFVVINDKRYKVIGNIGMNSMGIEVDESITINDKVSILGNGITLGMLSRGTNISNTEALLGIGNRNKRIYTKSDKEVENYESTQIGDSKT